MTGQDPDSPLVGPGGARTPQPRTAPTSTDLSQVRAELGREPRGVVAVVHRCTCGQPDVVQTSPVLPDGTPFPTLYYLTCPRAAAAVGTLEGSGLMREMQDRLGTDPQLATDYLAAHESYLAERSALGDVPALTGVSAGGMPTRVKCLHVLVAHALAAGPGVNPLGDQALRLLPDWGADGPCTDATDSDGAPVEVGGKS